MRVSDCKKMRPETGSVHPTTSSSCLGSLELVRLWAKAGTTTPVLVHAGAPTPSPNLCPSFFAVAHAHPLLASGRPQGGHAPVAEVSGARTGVLEQGRLAAGGGGGGEGVVHGRPRRGSHATRISGHGDYCSITVPTVGGRPRPNKDGLPWGIQTRTTGRGGSCMAGRGGDSHGRTRTRTVSGGY